MRNCLKSLREKQLAVFFLFFALIFVRYCYYGFTYFHQLDDYIQYFDYTHSAQTFSELVSALGLLAARPLAGLADILVWSRFFGFMIAAVAILSALFAASACLFRTVWSRHFGTGYAFLAVYTLLPLGIEGTYWVSASSRVVVGLFLVSLALWLFDRWCDTGHRRYLALFAVTQLASFGFYEQAVAVSITSVVLLAILYGAERVKRSAWCALSLASAAVYFGFTSLFKNSALYASKVGFISPLSAEYWKSAFPAVLGQITDAFFGGGFYTIARGFKRGVVMLFTDMNLVYFAVILALCSALYLIARRGGLTAGRPVAALITGLLMAIAPVTLFFVVENAWFSLRCAVMSFPGIALVADTLMNMVGARLKRGGAYLAAATVLFALVCCVASISEMHDYRQTTAKDHELTALVLETLTADGNIESGRKIAVLNVEPSYLEHQNYFYHEHIHGVTESGWAFTGALKWRADGAEVAAVTPLPKNPMYRPWSGGAMRLGNFDAVYIYLDGRIIPLRTARVTDGEYHLYDTSGGYIGKVWEEDGYGYLEVT